MVHKDRPNSWGIAECVVIMVAKEDGGGEGGGFGRLPSRLPLPTTHVVG